MHVKDSHAGLDASSGSGARITATLLLRLASRALDALAERMAQQPRPRLADPILEYHADAGAPEGALYIDGQLVGHVIGVTRL